VSFGVFNKSGGKREKAYTACTPYIQIRLRQQNNGLQNHILTTCLHYGYIIPTLIPDSKESIRIMLVLILYAC
jgi:hypothetical protein